MGYEEMNYISVTVFSKTLEHGQKITPWKLYDELSFAAEYGLKYIYIKNTERTAKFEVTGIIQLLIDWEAYKQKALYIDFPVGSKGMNFKRI